MQEVFTLARADGAKLAEDVVKKAMVALDRCPATGIGNLKDILNGRPSELETEVGAVVRHAHKLGVNVPRHSFLYASLLPQERQARGEVEFPTAAEMEAPKAA